MPIKSSVISKRLQLGPRSYSIHIGERIFRNAPFKNLELEKLLSPIVTASSNHKHAILIADQNLTATRQKVKSALMQLDWKVDEIPVTAGESLKDFRSIYPIYGQLLLTNATRNSIIFAIGGGSVGDAVGFIASTYLRGIKWIGIPTTLLAQVDSAIGGKTAINHDLGKNLIGTFYQPSAVFCDLDFLSTLSSREFISGYGEMVKYGLVFDPKFLAFLKTNWAKNNFEPSSKFLSQAIQQSVAWKCKTVAKDEFDQKGIRDALNFGHTLGHALESATDYKVFQHGEAVIWGMRFALALSVIRKKMNANLSQQWDSFLKILPVPALPAGLSFEKIYPFMLKDKKAVSTTINFVLIKKPGQMLRDAKAQEQDLKRAFDFISKAESISGTST